MPSFAIFQQDPSSYPVHPTCQIENLGKIYESVFGIGKIGRYVEVGAFDGIIYSNVWGLAMMGWKGIAIEPMEENLVKLKQTYDYYPNVLIEPVACSSRKHESLVMFSEREGSRLQEETNPRELPVVKVPAVTLDSILIKNNWETKFELLSIDTEGHDEYVLSGFSLQDWKPKMVIVETRGVRPKVFAENRYDVQYEDGLNTIFVRNANAI